MGDPTLLPAWCRALARAGRRAVPLVVIPVSLLGALLLPTWTVLGLGPLLGLFAAGVVLTAEPCGPVRPGTRRAAALAGAVGVLALPFAAGANQLEPVGGVLVLLVLVLGSAAALEQVAAADGDGPADEVLRTLPTAQLVAVWAAAGAVLDRRSSPRDRARAVRRRAAVLDELTRRDPEGVAAWLRAGGDPPGPATRADAAG
ncbi:hypothetical protein [Geodermatophilus marinus]|uniref:hypothetical protein n=1 Tax=Geodermatophilus sp. LHW52908 TaxID=2303986 RepID=UPI0011C19239|nr:hypothetical protein [Geodermatophilus sp. LHW52908]